MPIIKIRKSAFLLGLLATYSTSLIHASLIPTPNNNGMIHNEIAHSLSSQSVEFPFIKNEGQADSKISFYLPTTVGMTFITTSGELLYAISKQSDNKMRRKIGSLREQFKGGNAKPVGLSKSIPSLNYYLGITPNKLNTNLPSYDSVKLGEVWPRINVSLRSRNARIEKYFKVQPGGDISSIQVQISYAKELEIHKDGNLVVTTEIGPILFSEPTAYQIKNGKKVFLPIKYHIDDLTYGFKVKDYDPGITLFIDPLVMLEKTTS